MTHPQYTQQALSRYTLPRLKRIAADLGVTRTGDKRAAETWVDAIITHQSTQTHKVTDEQTLQFPQHTNPSLVVPDHPTPSLLVLALLPFGLSLGHQKDEQYLE